MRIVLTCLMIKILPGVYGQTIIPNGDFENWIDNGNYEDPQYWDTPNNEVSSIPFFGTTVVTKSSDHETGNYSVKLETKHIFILTHNIPGCITLGDLTVDVTNETYILTGGLPIRDKPQHMHGFYKYFPQGGDSCLIAIVLLKTTGVFIDTVAKGYLSTHKTINDWTPFSIWINYIATQAPQIMDIVALSSAQKDGTAGTVLYVDDFTLDFIGGIEDRNPQEGIEIYQDKETRRILVFYDFEKLQQTSVALYNMSGQIVKAIGINRIQKQKQEILYSDCKKGLYALQIIHDNQILTRKYFLDQ